MDIDALESAATRTITVASPIELYRVAVTDVAGFSQSKIQSINNSLNASGNSTPVGGIPNLNIKEGRVQIYVQPWVMQERVQSLQQPDSQKPEDGFISTYATITNPTKAVPDAVGYCHDTVDDEVVKVEIDRTL